MRQDSMKQDWTSHDRKGIYNFHFVMDTDMRVELEKLHLYKNAGNLSGFIVDIFTQLKPGLEYKYFYGKQMESRYKYVTDNRETAREHIHVYMPHYLYRQLKLLHQDLNYYSMAQLVRDFLRFFIDVVNEYGENYQEELINILKSWEKENRKKQFNQKKLIQLLHFIDKNPQKVRLLSVYTPAYTTIFKYRL
jgi:hypothetical protein